MLKKLARNMSYIATIVVSAKVINDIVPNSTKREIRSYSNQIKNKVVFKVNRLRNKW